MSGRIPILAKNLMILASAGSGKTYQLGNRVVGLVGARGVDPEKIVALTFTRKAAGEFADSVLTKLAAAAAEQAVAERLRSELGEALDASETLARVVRALPRFQLGTLDSFFSRVVRAFQYELGLTGGTFELVEGPRLETALADILAGILTEALDDGEGEEFLHAFKRATAGKEEAGVVRLLRQFFKTWHGLWREAPAPEALGRADAFGELPEAGEWEKQKEALLARLENAAVTIEWTDKRQKTAMEKLVDLLRSHTVGSGTLGSAKSGLFPKVMEWLAEGGPAGWTPKLYKEFFPGPMAEDVLRETMSLVAGCELAAAVERTRAVARLVECYDAECARRLRRRGLLGFQDVKMLMGEWTRSEDAQMRRLLVDFRLDARYDHWLLDEFQDTSRAEWTGVKTLIDEAVMGENGSLFVVGDPKQAIYGWRGGDVRLFDTVRRQYEGGLEEVTMPKSWRSCPQVLGLVNAVCGNIEVIRELFGDVANRWPWEPHESARPELHGEARVERVEGKSEERMNRLVGLLRGEVCLEQRSLSCGVLVRTNEQVRGIAEHLRGEGFDVIEEGSRRPVEDNPVGVAMFHLLRWLADPQDRFARELVAMSPVWEAVSERLDATAWQAIWERLLKEAHAEGFAAMMERTVEPLWDGLTEFGRRRAGDVVEALAAFDAAGTGTAREAVRWLEGLEATQSPGVAAVQVMTIHKSKGLGFDVVVLPEIEDAQVPNAGRFQVASDGEGEDAWLLQPPAKWVRQLSPALAEAEACWAEDQKYEALCLLYVALTRAKRGLYVLLPEAPKSRKEAETWASPANWIAQAIAGSDTPPKPQKPADIEEDAEKSGPTVLFQSGDISWIEEIPEREPPEARSTPPRLGKATPLRKRATPSSEKKASATRTAPVSFGGMAFGNRVHALFERIEWLGDSPPDLGDTEEAQLVQECLAVPEIAAIFQKRDGLQALREQPVEVVLDGTWTSGVIDRLLLELDPQGRPTAATIVDFKTDRVKSTEELASRYQSQINTYRQALAQIFSLPSQSIHGILVSTSLKELVSV